MTIHAIKSEEASDVIEVLRAAIQECFDDVIVIGRKGEEITISGNAVDDRVKMVGALELAKYELLSD